MTQSASNRSRRNYAQSDGLVRIEVPPRNERVLVRGEWSNSHDAPLTPLSLRELVAAARQALDYDVAAVRRYLDQLSALLPTCEPGPACGPALIDAAIMSSATEQARGGLAAWQLRRVADYVDKHLTSPLRVETLAQVVRLSPGHFCRAFKEHMGETPHGFIMRRRVRRAQILILTTVDSLSQIAHACGLSDQSHLTRLFRRYVGETPMAWRRKWQRSTQDDDFSCPLRPDGDRSFS